ncbi:MAG: AsmA family protein [Hyphomicrobiaceae bacterium]
MADSRQTWQGLGSWILGTALLATLVGLPVAVAMRAPVEQIASGMGRPRDAIIISQPQRLTSLFGLTINGGVLQGPKPSQWRASGQLDQIEADGLALTLDVAQPAPGSDAAAPLQVDLEQALSHLAILNFKDLVLRRSHVDILRADGSKVRLTDIDAHVRTTRKDAFEAKGTARYRGTAVTFTAAWSRPSDAKAAAVYPLKLSISGRALTASLDGRIDLTGTPKIEGRGEFKSPKLRVLARWLGLPVLPGEDLRNVAVAGDVTGTSGGTLSFANASVAIDGNQGAGALSLNVSGPRPKLDGTIAFKSFAVKHYVEALRGPSPNATLGAGPVRFADAHRSILALVDADLRLSVAKIKAPELELGRAALTLSLKNGRMLADLAELEIEGGTASGQVTLDANGDDLRLGLRLRGRQIDPGRALTDLMKRNPLLGRVNIALEATGSGSTLPAVARVLTGRGSFELVDGGRLGLDLKALAHVARTETASGWAAAGRGNTPLSALDVRFLLEQGLIKFETITAKSGGASIMGTGHLDTLNKAMDISLAFGSEAVTEVPVSNRDVLRLHGPWSEPLIGRMQSQSMAAPSETGPVSKGDQIRGFIKELKANSPVSMEGAQFGAFSNLP